MFSLTRRELAAGGQALLLTGDRDLFQVVGEGASIVELSKGAVAGEIGPAQVRERYGISPELVADFIALRGDPSDGLPGAPGVGAKTAAELLREYGSLEELLQAARRATSGIRPRIVQALRDHTQLLLDFKRIATLVEIELERPSDQATDFAAGALQARALGMVKLAERLQANSRA
jgi:DNA polymerase-1